MKESVRQLKIEHLLKSKSFFLLGPRSTGKTTLIHQRLPHARFYDLLDSRVFSRLLKNPQIIEEENLGTAHSVVIDEIQTMPSLLDEVQRLISKYNWRFLMKSLTLIC